jgi:uncharacterized protein YndB with AHSA1/START domain
METPMSETKTRTLAPLKVSRTFHAPRSLVFKAWSSAESVKRWFPPDGYTLPEARVQMQIGGPFEMLMRSPRGEEHRVRGKFIEVDEPKRLVIDMTIEDPTGHALFGALTEVDFSAEVGGTRMDVTQTYTILDPRAARMAEGAPQGWAQTLDKLSDEIRRMQAVIDSRSVVHAIFTVERTYDAPAAHVWRALSDEQAKAKWFGGGDDAQWTPIERSMDFRVGGRERAKVRWEGGIVTTFDAVYHDIIPNDRIVYTYEMHLDDRKISVSLATMQLKALGARQTTLKVTEQGAFLDGYDDAGGREHGTGYLLDKLGESLMEDAG